MNTTINEIENWFVSESLTIIIVVILILFSLLFFYLLFLNFKEFFKRKKMISVDETMTTKKPNLSATLSIIFPGFGQIYNREVYRGFFYIILTMAICAIIFFAFARIDPKAQMVRFSIGAPFIVFLMFFYVNSIRDAYKTSLVINKKIERTNKNAANMMKLGRTLYRKEKYQAAINIYTEIISSNPKHGLAYYNRGVVYYKVNNYLKAGKDFIFAARLGHKKAQGILKSEGIEYLNF